MTNIPKGFVEVTKEEFFKVMGPLNVHPSLSNPDYTSWEMLGSRIVVGRSLPGWKESGNPNVQKVWMLTEGK